MDPGAFLDLLFGNATIGILLEVLFAGIVLPALVGAVGGLLVAVLRRSPPVKGLWVGALVGAACGGLWLLFLLTVGWRLG